MLAGFEGFRRFPPEGQRLVAEIEPASTSNPFKKSACTVIRPSISIAQACPGHRVCETENDSLDLYQGDGNVRCLQSCGRNRHCLDQMPSLSPVFSAAFGPLLGHVIKRLAAKHPSIFDRLGTHVHTDYIIDPVELPFALHLRPDPQHLVFRAVSRRSLPPHDASIRGNFATLFKLIDAGADGDAAFFSRNLTISGNTEAVVSLRNALDDVDDSIAADTAALFGPPGRLALDFLRRLTRPDKRLPAS